MFIFRLFPCLSEYNTAWARSFDWNNTDTYIAAQTIRYTLSSARNTEMHVKLNQPIPSIKEMDGFDLPDFAVLIGRNGVGKTQLLQAIARGRATVSGLSRSNIEIYDIDTFRPNEGGNGGWGHSSFFLNTVEAYLSAKSGPPPVEDARRIFNETLQSWGLNDDANKRLNFKRAVHNVILGGGDFGAFGNIEGDEAVTAYFKSIGEEVINKIQPANRGSGTTQHLDSFNNDPVSLIYQAMRLSHKLPHEVTREDILRASHFEGKTIGNQLSEIFGRYKVEQFVWAHTESGKGGKDEKTVSSLMREYRNAHRPPWEILRETLDQMREASDDPELFNFEFSDPENEELSFGNHHQYSFSTQFTNRTTGDSYPVTELSSGEKIMVCLCLSVFNREIGQCQPGLILLDELDAVLHPSMISALIAGLKNQFVNKGTRVIMATHSVTTVSLLDEGEIFRMSRSGSRVDVRKVTKADAVDDLSEGLATIDAGLKIVTSDSAAPITILTEGNNALHLKKWASLFFPNEVGVFDKLPDRTGKNDLKTYGRFLAKVDTNSHFLIVWDCDAKGEAEQTRQEIGDSKNVTAFAFTRRNNPIAPKGIENQYDEEYFDGYTIKSVRESTGVLFHSIFSAKKKAFANHVSSKGTKEFFNHFGELENEVRKILKEREAGAS